MPKLSGISHKRAIKAFQKAGFQSIRQGKHISMAKGNTINGYTLAGIIKDAGLSIDEFRTLL